MNDQTRNAISRREFARRAALASAVASFSPAAAITAGSPPPQAPATAQQPPNFPKLPQESQAEADARAQIIFAEYASRFSEAQKTDIRRLCAVAQRQIDHLRAFNLENSNAPALYLKPLVEREKKNAAAPPPAKSPVGSAAKKP